MTREERAAKIAAAAPKERRGTRWAVVAAVLLLVVAGIGFAVYRGVSSQAPATASTVPKGGLPDGQGLNPHPDVKPVAGAPKVEVYTDFQCPICAEFEKSNGKEVDAAAKAGKISLVQHTMTFLDQNFHNDSSAKAANAASCAADQGVRDEFGLYLFSHQPQQEGAGYPDTIWSEAAKAAGLGGDKLATFEKCVTDQHYKDDVTVTDDRSARNGVHGTPTFVINGTMLTNAGQTAADWNALVQQPGSFEKVLAKYAK